MSDTKFTWRGDRCMVTYPGQKWPQAELELSSWRIITGPKAFPRVNLWFKVKGPNRNGSRHYLYELSFAKLKEIISAFFLAWARQDGPL